MTLEQQQLLMKLDAPAAAKLLDLAKKAEDWKAAIDQARVSAQNAGADLTATDGDPVEVATVVMRIASEIDPFVKALPQVREAISYEANVAGVVAEADRKWRSATTDREAAKRAAYSIASRKIRVHLDQLAFAKIAQFRNPAEYATSFFNGRFREWTERPLPMGDGEELVFRIIAPAAGVPIFSPEAQLGVQIQYMDELKVEATGLYFRYGANGQPEPVIDNLKVKVDVAATTLNKVRTLGQEFTENLDLPIAVTLDGNPDFATRGMSGLRGGIPFSVKVTVFEVVSLTGSNFVLYHGNRVDWRDSKLEVKAPMAAPVPIGPGPLAFYSLKGAFGPSDQSLGFGAQISTVATPPQAASLDVDVETRIPIEEIVFKGALTIVGAPLMTTKGKIDFARGVVAGEFGPGNSPLSVLGFVSGTFELRSERFIADGAAEVFGQRISDLHCEINLQDGSAVITASHGFNVFGVDVSGSVQGVVDPNFEHVTITCQGNVDVPGVKPYGTLPVSFLVTMESDGGIEVEVQSFVEGLDLKFSVDSLDACTIDELRRRLTDSAVKAYHQFLKDLAQGDKDMRVLGAKMDKQTRDFVDEHFGITWSTGNEDLDKLGGELTDFVKASGGTVSGVLQQGGAVATDVREGVQDLFSGKWP